MTSADWTLLERQGAREVWQKTCETPNGKTETRYRGEEYTELDGERQKVDDVRRFDTQTAALAWLNGETG
ncbi:hypothetical protein [Salipiger mucosus]|uniref:Uncharacterized protein n=1 Tax=Salipiger mucosus DSM 16094 TaxID=1123237 RepID=S9RWD8_9RHOB|nr:hypothetical protein [Salipiger mucosus]EPX78329.1 hypothetical protein Salmuc_03945 [Salipiger mucosus DSM 16094]